MAKKTKLELAWVGEDEMSKLEPIYFRLDQVEIQGIVSGVLRKF